MQSLDDLSAKFLDIAGVMMVAIAPDESVSIINRRGCEVLGWAEEEVVGSNWFDRFVPERCREQVRAAFQDLMAGKIEGVEHYENPVLTKSGEERAIAWHNALLRNEDGEITASLSSGKDITDSQLAEAALRESEARIRAIVNTAVDGIITIDDTGIIESFNASAERIFGYKAAEVVGENVRMLMPAPDRKQHDGYIKAYLETGKRKIIGIGREVLGIRKDGSMLPLDLSVSVLMLENRRVFTGIIRDMTEKHQIEGQMRQQDKLAAVGLLAAGVAHEIGNPLASISAVAQNLLRKVDDEYLTEKLGLIGKHIARISETVRQMVDFAHPPRKDWRTCELNQILEDALNIVKYDRRARRVSIQKNLAADLPPVRAMADQLTQVFINIALNAFDALEDAPDGRTPELRVSTSRREDDKSSTIRVAFEDNGPGIDPDVIDRIMEPFFTTKQIGAGTGLGLSVSYGIVREHSGTIHVDGRPGEGARFVIDLPADRSSDSRRG